MKYIIVIIFCLCSKSSKAQIVIDTSWYTIDTTLTHTDSVNTQLVDTIYANRSNYIGYPMSKLYANLPYSIGFSQPYIGISRSIGTGYYKHFTLFLPCSLDDAISGFIITIASKVYTSVKDYIDKNDAERDTYARELLKDAIITSIERNY